MTWITVFLIIFATVCFSAFLGLYIRYTVHWIMTKEYSQQEGQKIKSLTYKEFIILFEQSDLRPSKEYSNSLFSENWMLDKSEYHADLINFKGQYYLLDFVSYFLVKNYIKKWLKNYHGLFWEYYFYKE